MTKKKFSIIFTGVLLFTTVLSNIVKAETPVASFDYESVKPVYILFTWGNFNPQVKFPEAKSWKGGVSVGGMSDHGGRLTVARDILITSDEKLTNTLNDVGKIDTVITTETTTQNHFKGMIVKYFPLYNKLGNESGISFTQNDHSIELNSEDLYHLNQKFTFDDGTEMRVEILQYQPSNENSDENFRNKMEVMKRMIGMERWIREKVDQGIVGSTSLSLQDFRSLFWKSFEKEYSSEQVMKIRSGFSRIMYQVNNKGLKPSLAIAAVKRLVQ